MYALNWITDQLATGHAPMSYEALDAIRAQGVSAIVNLCGEFCDLHQVEEEAGFEVYYLPIADECAPDLAAMEKALDWLDEALYLNKKVLVHCRLGHGRTGTFIAAYLLRRGFDFTSAAKTMKGRNANPATYQQRSFLKKYGSQVGPLRTAVPRIGNRPTMDISPLLRIYEELLVRMDRQLRVDEQENCCGRNNSACCRQPFDLYLIESIHLSQAINKNLNQEQRQRVLERASNLAEQLQKLHRQHPGSAAGAMAAAALPEPLHCPLLESGQCLVLADRPPRCRYWGIVATDEQSQDLFQTIVALSQQTFLSLTGRAIPVGNLMFSSADTISGKFVQLYFQAMAGGNS